MFEAVNFQVRQVIQPSVGVPIDMYRVRRLDNNPYLRQSIVPPQTAQVVFTMFMVVQNDQLRVRHRLLHDVCQNRPKSLGPIRWRALLSATKEPSHLKPNWCGW